MAGRSFYAESAAAYVRASLPDLDVMSEGESVQAGLAAGLRLSPFKRSRPLPRVGAVLGALRSIMPADLLDIGSGRGAFLWPLLDAFPGVPVTVAETDDRRAKALALLAQHGVDRLRVVRTDVQALSFSAGSFDVVTFLEVLEHLPDPQAAAREAIRVARRFVILSVPSKPDNNPQHLHVFSPNDLRRILSDGGASHVSVSHVLNHRVVVASV